MSAAVPMATALAPSASALATSAPLRMPPAATRSISSARPTSSSALRACTMPAISGMPVSSVRMCGPALVDAGGQRAHVGDLFGHLLAHQVAAGAGLAALADEDLAGVGLEQVVRVEAVAALDALIVPLGGVFALLGDGAAVAAAGGRAGHGGALGQGDLGVLGERAIAHARDVDRDVQHQRVPGEAGAEHRLRLALLAVALDDEARERGGQEGQVVKLRDLLEHAKAAHAVAADLRLDVDVVDNLSGPDGAAPHGQGFHVSSALKHHFAL